MYNQELYNKKLTSGRIRKNQEAKLSGLSPKTVREIHSLLHKALDQAVKWQSATKNVATAVSPPRKEKKQVNFWDKNEVNTFLKHIEQERCRLS